MGRIDGGEDCSCEKTSNTVKTPGECYQKKIKKSQNKIKIN